MHWLAQLTPRQALIWAAAWPVILLGVPAAVAMGYLAWSSSETQHVSLVIGMDPGQSPWITAAVIGPPLLFIAGWVLARSATGRRR